LLLLLLFKLAVVCFPIVLNRLLLLLLSRNKFDTTKGTGCKIKVCVRPAKAATQCSEVEPTATLVFRQEQQCQNNAKTMGTTMTTTMQKQQ
jgi:hypothetical protein